MFQFFQTIIQKIVVALTGLIIGTGIVNPGTKVTPPVPLPPTEINQPTKIKNNVPKPKTTIPTKKSNLSSDTQTQSLSNAEIIQKVKPATVYIETQDKVGSGFIIDRSGLVLTNAHVVSGNDTATVKLSDGKTLTGSVIGRNENVDLAIIKIKADNLPAVELGDSDQVAQGDSVYALGYPFGLKGDVSFTQGVISRKVTTEGTTYLETSVQIHPGNSGGPLVDQFGKVVGINTSTLGATVQGTAVGETIKLAIPINIAKNYLPQLEAGQNIIKPSGTPSLNQPLPAAPNLIPPPLSGNEDFSQYQRVTLNKFTNDPTSYLGQKILISNYITQFLPKGGTGGSSNYIRFTDPISSVEAMVEIANPDDYSKVAKALTVNSPMKVYGIGSQPVKFAVSGRSTLFPIVEVRKVDICPAGASYGNTGPDANDPWLVGCYGDWKQILP